MQRNNQFFTKEWQTDKSRWSYYKKLMMMVSSIKGEYNSDKVNMNSNWNPFVLSLKWLKVVKLYNQLFYPLICAYLPFLSQNITQLACNQSYQQVHSYSAVVFRLPWEIVNIGMMWINYFFILLNRAVSPWGVRWVFHFFSLFLSLCLESLFALSCSFSGDFDLWRVTLQIFSSFPSPISNLLAEYSHM